MFQMSQTSEHKSIRNDFYGSSPSSDIDANHLNSPEQNSPNESKKRTTKNEQPESRTNMTSETKDTKKFNNLRLTDRSLISYMTI